MSENPGARDDAAEVVWMGGIGVVYRIDGRATGGAFSVIEHLVRPGAMTPPHRHAREHEISYVLEGVLSAEVGGSVVRVLPGGFATKPKGVPHVFWNEGPGLLRFLEIISPAGFEAFFREGSKLVPPDAPPDEAGLMRLSEKYGIENQMDRVPELMRRYGVRLLGLSGPPPRGAAPEPP